MNWRSKKLTDSARNHACVNCGRDDGTIVWAHSNSIRHDKGTGIKAHDLFGAYLCHKCHSDYDAGTESKSKKEQFFLSCWEKSMLIACKNNYIK